MKTQEVWNKKILVKLQLSSRDVHIWRVSLHQPEDIFAKLSAMLSKDEHARAERFKFEKHRRRFIVARGVLRDILRRYIDLRADAISFEYEKHGKPILVERLNSRNISFNVSHSEEMAVFAVTCNHAVGVDIEFVPRSLSNPDKIAKRFFSPAESDALLQLPEKMRREAFFTCWTRKEAFIKAIGEGLTHPLHQFEVAFLPGESPALLHTRPDTAEAEKWTLSAFVPAENYIGAIVVEGQKPNFAYWQWQGKDI